MTSVGDAHVSDDEPGAGLHPGPGGVMPTNQPGGCLGVGSDAVTSVNQHSVEPTPPDGDLHQKLGRLSQLGGELAQARLEAAAPRDVVGAALAAMAQDGSTGRSNFSVVSMSAATRAVRRARTVKQFGAALNQLRTDAGLSLKVLADRFWKAGLPSLSKTTLSRSCNGRTLFQTEQQVIAFVAECGEPDATEWVAAWRRVLEGRRAHEPQRVAAGTSGLDRDGVDGSASAADMLEQIDPDDEVLGEVRVPLTRKDMRMAKLYEGFISASRGITAHLLVGGSSQDALNLIVTGTHELFDADCAAILLSDRRVPPTEIVVRAAAGKGASELLGLIMPVAEPPVAEVFDMEGVELIPDLSALVPSSWSGPAQEFGPAVVVPLRWGNVVAGVLLATRTRGGQQFLPEHAPVLASFADQAAVALELAEKHRQERALAVLADRDRIAGDLHDHVIQRLFATGMSLQGTVRRIADPDVRRRVSRAVEQLDETVFEIRTSIFDLHTTGTSRDDSLRRRMLDIIAELSQGAEVSPQVRISGAVDTLVPEDLAVHATAVLREAVSNSIRHADASAIVVTVVAATDLIIDVVDDGIGMPPGVARSGLISVERRAAKCGGNAVVVPGPDGGTRLTWRAPLSTDQNTKVIPLVKPETQHEDGMTATAPDIQ